VKAWQALRYGAPSDVLRIGDLAVPEPAAGEVRIRVTSFTLNFNDLDMIYGRYRSVIAQPPFVPGMEVLGRVEACGAGAEAWLDRRVAAMPSGARGGYAETAIASASWVFEIPEDIPEPEAAAILFPFHLAWFGLHDRGRLRAGEVLLVHAAAGGIGSAALQLGVDAGARVLATAGSPEKLELCRRLGADVAINYRDEDFTQQVLDATGGHGVDVAFDAIGGAVTAGTFPCMAFNGRHLIVGYTSGTEALDQASIVPRPLVYGNFSLAGVSLGYVEDALRAKMASPGYNCPSRADGERIHEQVIARIRQRAVRPIVGMALAFEALPEGLVALEERRTVGRVVVRV
jgi:NADPH2:quinone reductase